MIVSRFVHVIVVASTILSCTAVSSSAQGRSGRIQLVTNQQALGRIEGHDTEDSRLGFSAQPNDKGKGHKIVFNLANGRAVQIISSIGTDELSIRDLGGNTKTPLDNNERTFLKEAAKGLKESTDINTSDIQEVGTQTMRAAELLAGWPDTLPIDYTFDVEKENARHEALVVKDARDGPQLPSEAQGNNIGGRGLRIRQPTERRLAYTSLCPYVNSQYWVEVTHDCFWTNRGDDKTTFFAWISSSPACPVAGGGGTYFYKNNQWVCYTPDHDTNVEYAYGECFGRCGAGCGSGTTYTKDCADHDSCVRFGHSLASLYCDDEFTTTVDDAMFAPSCF